MFSWVVWTLFTAGGLLLLAAGVGHVVRRRHLAAVLTTHRVTGAPRRLIATTLGFAEIVVGAAVVSTAATGAVSAPAGVTATVVYAAFVGYLARLLRVAPGADCGCFGSDEPVTGWTVARAVLLAATSLAAVFVPGPAASLGQGAVLLGAGVVAALILTVLTSLGSLIGQPPVKAEPGHH